MEESHLILGSVAGAFAITYVSYLVQENISRYRQTRDLLTTLGDDKNLREDPREANFLVRINSRLISIGEYIATKRYKA